MRRAAVVLFALVLASCSGSLTAARPDDRIAALEARVTQLEARVSVLEATPAPSATLAPTPLPSAVPTATPTASPAPTPRPTVMPTPIPTVAPSACEATFADAPTTASDQSGAIAAFLRANAGRVICFAPGATYRVDARIVLEGWSGTVLGRGATFRRFTATTTQSAHFRIVQSHDVVFDGLNVTGPALLADIRSRVFGDGDREDQHAFSVESTAGFTLRNATLTGLWGDGVYLRARNSGGIDSPATDARIEDVAMDVIGRNCISVISAQRLAVTRVRCANVSLHGFDAEPNRSTDVVRDVTIADSDWRGFDAGHTASGPGYAIVLTPGYADVQVADIAILRNTMDRARVRVDGYSPAAPARNVTVTGNRPDVAGDATFTHVEGLVFSDNGLMGYEAAP